MSKFNDAIDTNPLLKGFPLEIDRGEWWQRLAMDPFFGEDIESLTPVRRDLLLNDFGKIYAPTPTVTDIAYRIHCMVIGGWIDRHPYVDEQKQLLYELSGFKEDGYRKFPCVSTSPRGMLLEGITKQGKTTLIKRVLSQYPQVIMRDRDERAGWASLPQLVYLVIPMPSDSSKSGFLMQAFIELDRALGTHYSDETTIRNGTVDVQLVQLLAKLAVHRCGVLIIEEAQESNGLTTHKFGQGFQTFFLRVLNTGIPTILMGNPHAFTELKTSSQLMSRLSDPGIWQLRPSAAPTSPEWTQDLVPVLWGKTLLPEPDEPIPDLEAYLWKLTGGFAHFLSVLRRETLREAFDKKARRVMKAHVEGALRSRTMTDGRAIIDNFWAGQKGMDVDFSDLQGPLNPTIFAGRNRRQPQRRGLQ